MGPKPYDGDLESQVSTTFSEAPPYGLTAPEKNSIIALVNLALFQLKCHFLCFRTHFFEFGPVFGCHAPLPPKNQLDIRMLHSIPSSEKKKFLKKLQEQKSSPDLENLLSRRSGC